MIYIVYIVLSFNMIKVPFDAGANKRGSSLFPDMLENKLYPTKSFNIKVTTPRETFGNVYFKVWDTLTSGELPMTVGGDHSVAIPSIFASNTYCESVNKKLGVLWLDAHADFNTIETSPTKNIHGVPVSVLCGHTLTSLMYGNALDTDQFAYYGLRDLDCLEFDRIQEYNMHILSSYTELKKWSEKYDKIHISFDVDCLDPSVMPSVNTPVQNGLDLKTVSNIFKTVYNTKKLLSIDVVEFNPLVSEMPLVNVSNLLIPYL